MTCVAYDPRDNEKYVKVYYDFNEIYPSIQFNNLRVQQIDANYSWLLAYVTQISPIEFSYQANKSRTPGLFAILLKRIDYVMNKKVDGDWKKITFKASPYEKWLLDLVDVNHEGIFDHQLSGLINFSYPSLEACPNKHSPDPNATGMMQLMKTHIDFNLDLPNADFKPSADTVKRQGGNYSSAAAKKKEPLDIMNGYLITQDGLSLAKSIISKFDSPSEEEKLAITLAVLMDKLNNR